MDNCFGINLYVVICATLSVNSLALALQHFHKAYHSSNILKLCCQQKINGSCSLKVCTRIDCYETLNILVLQILMADKHMRNHRIAMMIRLTLPLVIVKTINNGKLYVKYHISQT